MLHEDDHFDGGSVEGLHAKRTELMAKGVKVTPVVDPEWAPSISFEDPAGPADAADQNGVPPL